MVYTTATSIVWKDFLETTPEIYVMKFFCANAQVRSHKGRLNFLSPPLRGSLPIWPDLLILATNATHDGNVVSDIISKSKGKMSGSQSSIEVFAVST